MFLACNCLDLLPTDIRCRCWGHYDYYEQDKDCRFYATFYGVRACRSCSSQRDKNQSLGFSQAIHLGNVVRHWWLFPLRRSRCLDSRASREP